VAPGVDRRQSRTHRVPRTNPIRHVTETRETSSVAPNRAKTVLLLCWSTSIVILFATESQRPKSSIILAITSREMGNRLPVLTVVMYEEIPEPLFSANRHVSPCVPAGHWPFSDAKPCPAELTWTEPGRRSDRTSIPGPHAGWRTEPVRIDHSENEKEAMPPDATCKTGPPGSF
jgi:hypothetical protein